MFGVFADDQANGGWFLLEFDARIVGVDLHTLREALAHFKGSESGWIVARL